MRTCPIDPLLLICISVYPILFFTINCSVSITDRIIVSTKLNNDLEKILVEIIKGSTEKEATIHVLLPSSGHVNLYIDFMNYNMLLKAVSSNWKVVVSNAQDVRSSILNTVKPESYIFLTSDLQPVRDLIHHVMLLRANLKSWNPYALFIIVLSISNFKGHDKLSVDILNYMWSQNLFKSYILLSSLGNKSEFKLITSLPYSHSGLCRTIKNSNDLIVHHFNEFSSISGLHLTPFNSIKNFHKCTIYATTYPFPPYSIPDVSVSNNTTEYTYKSGFEVSIVLLLAEISNISLVFRTPDINYNPWYEVLPNGSSIGMTDDLKIGKTDLAFAGVIPVPAAFHDYDYSKTYFFGSISWFVPNPNQIPHWQSLIKVFTIGTWFALILAFITITILFHIIQKITVSEEYGAYTEYISAALILFGIGIGSPSFKLPKNKYLKLLFALWVFYSLHIITAYTSLLYGFITHPSYEKGIDTVDDLLKSGLKTCVSDLYYGIYNETDDDKIDLLLNNRLECNDLNKAIKLFVQYRNFSLLAKVENFDFVISESRSNIHKVSEKFVTYNLMLIANKGNVVLSRLNWVISQAIESGLFNKWKSDIILFNTMRLKYYSGTDLNYAPHSLGLTDIQGSIFILVMGFLLSVFVFIGELIKFKYFTIN